MLMNWLRTNSVLKAFTFIFALLVLNASVDPVDEYPNSVSEDLSNNEMESVTELILEEFLDIVNCFPEHDDHDHHDRGHRTISHHYQVFFQQSFIRLVIPERSLDQLYILQNDKLYTLHSGDVLIPPPRG